MTHAEIYRTIQQLVPQELLDKYGHLCYGEMAEVPELALGRAICGGQRKSGRKLACRKPCFPERGSSALQSSQTPGNNHEMR